MIKFKIKKHIKQKNRGKKNTLNNGFDSFYLLFYWEKK